MNIKRVSLILVLLIAAGAGSFIMNFTFESDIDRAEEIAENWIKNQSPTYVFDGFDLSLEEKKEAGENEYFFVYAFKSRGAGYGDRSDQMIAQVITDHELQITVEENNVVRAVNDETYDELNDRFLTRKIELVFYRTLQGQEEPAPVHREIKNTENIERKTLQLLLEGPNEREEERGIYSTISDETELLDFKIENQRVRANFSRHLEPDGGSAWVRAIRTQITSTLQQFETIEEVEIAVEGKKESILQP